MYSSPENIANTFIIRLERKKTEIAGAISSNLLSLFWEIGTKFNDLRVKGDIDIESISTLLTKNYGGYFKVHNIKIMMTLSNKYSLETIKKIAYFVSWEYISQLVRLNTNEQLFRVINIIHTESLNPSDLELKNGADDLISNSNVKNYTNGPLSGLRMGQVLSEKIRIEYLKKGSDFLWLMQLNDESTAQLLDLSKSNEQILLSIINLINFYQAKTNYFVNTYFNNMFWEFGDRLMETLDGNSLTVIQNKLDKIVEQLEIRSSSFLSKELLYNCIKFAKIFKIPGEQVEFTKGLSWDEIKQGLDVINLQKEIEFDKTFFNMKRSYLEYPSYNSSSSIFRSTIFLDFICVVANKL